MVLSLKHLWLILRPAADRARVPWLDARALHDRALADLAIPEEIRRQEEVRRLKALGMGRW
jgi:hypothetical protein